MCENLDGGSREPDMCDCACHDFQPVPHATTCCITKVRETAFKQGQEAERLKWPR